ncbi:hypothetical protein [Bradyrhizobium sp. ORS 375]|uniref:hypothetical protein n=1 Tax=Bradyrhizobium sp. (strain ORS 375) TaxID=566679 RepID=UPI00054E1C4F|nr:hypothetical protein [Bradyrhizobium sp. ORS 375]
MRFDSGDRDLERLHQARLFCRIVGGELLQLVTGEFVDGAAQLLRVATHGVDRAREHEGEFDFGMRSRNVLHTRQRRVRGHESISSFMELHTHVLINISSSRLRNDRSCPKGRIASRSPSIAHLRSSHSLTFSSTKRTNPLHLALNKSATQNDQPVT